jgi:hypothetical protein
VDLEDNLAGIAIVLPDRRPERLLAAYVNGTSDGVTALLWGLRVLIGHRGCETLRIRPPDSQALLQALEVIGARLAWDESILIFERGLAGNRMGSEEDYE